MYQVQLSARDLLHQCAHSKLETHLFSASQKDSYIRSLAEGHLRICTYKHSWGVILCTGNFIVAHLRTLALERENLTLHYKNSFERNTKQRKGRELLIFQSLLSKGLFY